MEEGNEIILKMFNCPVSKNKDYYCQFFLKDNRITICSYFQYEKNIMKKNVSVTPLVMLVSNVKVGPKTHNNILTHWNAYLIWLEQE